MANFNFYFASCALLLLTLSWRTSTGLPVRPVRSLSPEKHAQCSFLFRSLLLNVTELLNSDVLCYSIASDKVEMSKAETVEACAPTQTQNSSCMTQRNSSFSESGCLRSIMKDLAHYEAAIQTYLSSTLRSYKEEVALLSPTLGIIQNLRKNCSPKPNGETDSSEADAVKKWENSSYDNRNEMCKMMRGFHIRTITINRAMGYMSSGDHRK